MSQLHEGTTSLDTALEGIYTNWKGETKSRKIVPLSLRYGATEWHPEKQWLLIAKDEKGNKKEFALKDFNFSTKQTTQSELS